MKTLTLFWCHDADGELRHVIAEVHNTYGGRHAYLLPPDSGQPAMVAKKLYVSPFNDVSGYYLVRAPRPDAELDVTISLHRENQPAFVATMRGDRRRATVGQILRLQLVAPLAPLMGAAGFAPRASRCGCAESRWYRGRRSPRRRGSTSCDHLDVAATVEHDDPAERWPDVAQVPAGALSVLTAAIAERLFRRAAARLPLRLRLPRRNGRRRRRPDAADDGDPPTRGAGPTRRPLRPDRLRRVLHGRRVELRRPRRRAHRVRQLGGRPDSPCAAMVSAARRRAANRVRSTTAATQARRNVAEHYDLSNDLFAEFLDETMTYSSALFDTLPACRAAPGRGAAPQDRPPARLGARRPGSRVLEIGTGWGELCIRAAARGAHVRSVTLSAEQQQLARQRVAAAGLSRPGARSSCCDYRDVDGRYDAVVSVEMIEAVGYHFWPTYFTTLDRLVPPGGRVAIQAITMPHDRMLATPQHLHLDPEVHLPRRPAAVHRGDPRHHRTAHPACAPSTCCRCARTTPRRCGCGGSASSQQRDAVSALGFDEVFHRMWELYLAYSEAGFRSGYLDVYQWTFAPTGGTLMNFVLVSVRRVACWRWWWCTASPSSSAAASAATTSST